MSRVRAGTFVIALGVAAALLTVPGACSVPIDVGGQLEDGATDDGATAVDAQGTDAPGADAPDDAVKRCTSDVDCAYESICIEERCAPCPDTSACAPPLNQVPLRRNGCATCDVAPASQCAAPADCVSGFSCVRGARCAAGCAELSCCANTCAEPGCNAPAPVGCAMPCESVLQCTTCIAAKCRCLAGSWDCVAGCTSDGFVAACTL